MKARILIVDDNRELAEDLVEIFGEEGVEARWCSTRGEVEALVQGEAFELVVLDILLGSESGLDLVPMLREVSEPCEIILMTGNATVDSAIQAIERGVFAYIQKPVAPQHLVTLARRALGQVALRREKETLQRQLAASEALHRDVVETVEACILGVDSAGVIRFANRYTLSCSGLKAQDIEGAPLSRLWHGESGLDKYLDRALRGKAVRDVERSLQRPDGSLRTIRWNLACLRTADNPAPEESGAAAVLAVGLDVTERVELERRNAESQALAAMGTLTTGLAHEIRNPLNAAKLQLELLVRRARKNLGAEGVERVVGPALLVQDEIARLSALLNEFLDLARPRYLERRALGVRELLEDVAALQGPVIENENIELRVRVSPPDLCVQGDKGRLKQVLINLVTNAVDAMRERAQGFIELAAEPYRQGVRITVSDNGPGVAPEVMGTAFQPFVTNKEAGTGLGLPIVKALVESHGGRVSLQSRPGGGTVVEVRLAGCADASDRAGRN